MEAIISHATFGIRAKMGWDHSFNHYLSTDKPRPKETCSPLFSSAFVEAGKLGVSWELFSIYNKFDLYTVQESFSNAETSWSMAGPAFKGKIQRKGRWLGEKEDGLLSCSEASPYTLTSWWQWREPDWFTQSPAKEIILLFAGKFLIWQCLEPDLIGEIIQLSIIIRSLPTANKMLRLLVLFYNRYFHRRQGMYLKTLFWNCEGSKIPLHHKHSLETH